MQLLVGAGGLLACGHGGGGEATLAGRCVLPTSASTAPTSLQATGCFGTAGDPAANLRAYTVNAASWSSGASKGRWLALPAGGQATLQADGAVALPPSSGVFKHFERDGARLETRLMLQDANGVYSGLSYVWNDAQTAATLSANGGAVTVKNVAWTVPTRAQCMTCHNAIAGRLLALRSEQLDVPAGAAAGAVGTLDAWIASGVVADSSHAKRPVAWPDPLGTAPLVDRARSYLATNCSFCHQPGAPSGTQTNYLFTTPLPQMGVCDVTPTRGNLGIEGAMLITPGRPALSVLSARIHSNEAATMMPPIGRTTVDTAGAAVIDGWISAIGDCNGP